MIGIVVVSHGKLARELVAATEHVVGEQDRFRSISIEVEDDIEARRDQIRETAKSCDNGKGVIILTDMFGGTPSNLAMSVMNTGNVEVLSGVNLPMLIKLAEVRGDLSLKDAAKVAAEAGRKYINIASELLTKSNGCPTPKLSPPASAPPSSTARACTRAPLPACPALPVSFNPASSSRTRAKPPMRAPSWTS